MKTKHVVVVAAASAIFSGWFWLRREAPAPPSSTDSPHAESAAAPRAAAHPASPRLTRPSRAEPADTMAATAQPGAVPVPAEPGIGSPDDPSAGPSEDVRVAMEQAQRERSTPEQRARALEERNRELEKLEQSGEDAGHWEPQLRGVRAELEHAARRIDLAASVSDLTCFQGGCYLSVLQENEAAAQALATNLQRGGSVSEWQGGAFSSGIIETESGRVETTIIFFAPGEPNTSEG